MYFSIYVTFHKNMNHKIASSFFETKPDTQINNDNNNKLESTSEKKEEKKRKRGNKRRWGDYRRYTNFKNW